MKGKLMPRGRPTCLLWSDDARRPPTDDESSVLDEWAELKAAIKAEAGLHSLKSDEFWARMLIHYSDNYSRVLKLVVIALLIPADTSECERVFSLMNDLKMSERNRIITLTCGATYE